MSAPAMQRKLAFDQNPPLMLPMRFFLSAPLFAALAAALLLWQGSPALLSRWSPHTLALTHLLTLGCLSMTMVGALMQLLPVVAGISLPRAGTTATVVHLSLCTGTLLLAAAFWLEQPWLFRLAMAVLLTGLLTLLVSCTLGLWQQSASGAAATVAAIRLALAALAITMVLGGMLAGAFAWPAGSSMPLLMLTDLHAQWGLFGWVGLLVIGVAFQVVPMFQVTEPYPEWLRRWFTSALFLLLLASSISATLPQATLVHTAGLLGLVVGFSAFAAVTLWLLAHRKRPKADTTTLFWRTAMASLLVLPVLWLLPSGDDARSLAAGVLLIIGFALSTINGMLYKIVPFLTWYHLQDSRMAGHIVPGVNQIIADAPARRQFLLHLLALLTLVGACYWPILCRPAAALLCLSCLLLWKNICTAMQLYARLRVAPAAP